MNFVSTENNHALTAENYLPFILGGNAIFVVQSLTTNKHYTFKVSQSKSNKTMYFVSVLVDYNSSQFVYVGFINTKKSFSLNLSAKSKYTADSPVFMAFQTVLTLAVAKKSHPKLLFLHLGKCGKCGRPLTDPLSIEIGLGPICRSN